MLRNLFRFAAMATLAAAVYPPPARAAGPQRPKLMAGKSARQPAAHVHDRNYEIVEIQIPGAVFALGVEVNAQGVVGGTADLEDGRTVTFVWSPGQLEFIAYPGALFTSVPALTNNGLLAGNWGSFTEQTAGWYDPKSGTWHELPPYPGKPLNIIWRMNSSGRAVGQSCDGNFYLLENCISWVWTGKGYQEFSVPGVPGFVTQGINDRGQIVGYSLITPPFGFAAYLYDEGAVTPLLVNGGIPAVAYDITNNGRVLMLAELDPQDFFRPLVHDRGITTPLPLYPGALQTIWLGFNERGDLTGLALGQDFSGTALFARRK